MNFVIFDMTIRPIQRKLFFFTDDVVTLSSYIYNQWVSQKKPISSSLFIEKRSDAFWEFISRSNSEWSKGSIKSFLKFKYRANERTFKQISYELTSKTKLSNDQISKISCSFIDAIAIKCFKVNDAINCKRYVCHLGHLHYLVNNKMINNAYHSFWDHWPSAET